MYVNVAPHAWSPPISPSAKKQRNAFTDSRLLRNTNPAVASRMVGDVKYGTFSALFTRRRGLSARLGGFTESHTTRARL